MSTMLVDERSRHEGKPLVASVDPLTRDFLAWVASRPRSYAEAMEAWRTSCPRFPIWEDALGDGLVRVERSGTTMSEARVVLTARGQAVLDGD
jgi:hypothetical protein